ncbi:MAG TPA: hypothetical protein ENJ08_09865 [Gammaproteobacteria bacterium]|nr:hypothetical protein [Gammaproteobacteria bacterium]
MKLFNRSFFLTLLILFATVFLGACSSDGEERREYMDAYSVEELEVPPRLTAPDTSGAMKLPEPAETTGKSDCN